MTSDAGIENAIQQYMADLEDVNKAAQKEEEAAGSKDDGVQTITEDSPI
jgi:hypothetical protein